MSLKEIAVVAGLLASSSALAASDPPPPAQTAPAVLPKRFPSDVLNVIKPHTNEIANCGNGDTQITASFTVTPAGEVTNVALASATKKLDDAVVSCVTAALTGIRFPAASDSSPVKFPFRLHTRIVAKPTAPTPALAPANDEAKKRFLVESDPARIEVLFGNDIAVRYSAALGQMCSAIHAARLLEVRMKECVASNTCARPESASVIDDLAQQERKAERLAGDAVNDALQQRCVSSKKAGCEILASYVDRANVTCPP